MFGKTIMMSALLSVCAALPLSASDYFSHPDAWPDTPGSKPLPTTQPNPDQSGSVNPGHYGVDSGSDLVPGSVHNPKAKRASEQLAGLMPSGSRRMADAVPVSKPAMAPASAAGFLREFVPGIPLLKDPFTSLERAFRQGTMPEDMKPWNSGRAYLASAPAKAEPAVLIFDAALVPVPAEEAVQPSTAAASAPEMALDVKKLLHLVAQGKKESFFDGKNLFAMAYVALESRKVSSTLLGGTASGLFFTNEVQDGVNYRTYTLQARAFRNYLLVSVSDGSSVLSYSYFTVKPAAAPDQAPSVPK